MLWNKDLLNVGILDDFCLFFCRADFFPDAVVQPCSWGAGLFPVLYQRQNEFACRIGYKPSDLIHPSTASELAKRAFKELVILAECLVHKKPTSWGSKNEFHKSLKRK